MTRRPQRVLVVLAVVVLGACSKAGDERGESSTTSDVASSTAATRASTTTSPQAGETQPPATDIAAVTPALQDLIDRYDAAVRDVLRDPRVAADRASQPVRDYLGLFASDSAFAEGALQFWVQEGERGRFYRAGPRGQLTESTVATVSPASPDEATFTICALNSIEITDGAGAVIESQGGQSAASVTAIRVNGVWILRDLTQAPATSCPAPAGA